MPPPSSQSRMANVVPGWPMVMIFSVWVRRHGTEHALDVLRVGRVHDHGHAHAGMLFAHRLQGLEAAQVRAQQHRAAALRQGVVEQRAAAVLQVELGDVAAREVQAVEHDPGKGVHMAVAVDPARLAAECSPQVADRMAARRR